MDFKKIIVLISLLFLFNCGTKQAKELTCRDFKTGVFELSSLDNHIKYLIERTLHQQTEKDIMSQNNNANDNKVFKVTWLNSCEYNLLIDTLKSTYDDFYLQMNALGGLNNKILSIDGKCALIKTQLQEKYVISKQCKVENKF